MPRKINYQPIGYQRQFHESTKPKVHLSTGFGGGKTYSLVMHMFKLMDDNKKMPGGVLVPNIKMYKRDVLPIIFELIRNNHIPYKYNKTESTWYFPDTGSAVYVFHSEDEGQSIRGPTLAWGVVNELTLVSRMAYLAFISRIRLKGALNPQVASSATPEGFNWAYEYFIEQPRKDTDLIFGDMRENIHIADTYAKMLQDSFDPLMQEQYIEGKYVNLVGKRCIYAFNRFKHCATNVHKIARMPVLVSMDFNVDPMTATLGHIKGETNLGSQLPKCCQ